MSFWTYMLHCRGGYFYVGHTDDLDRRIGEHKSGLIPGFTAEHQPVELVWSDSFQTRDDAKAAETRLKGWSRAKKLALIRGDWERISALAKAKDSPSTSSGKSGKGEGFAFKPVRPELVEGPHFSLRPHPDTLPRFVDLVSGAFRWTGLCKLAVRFVIHSLSQSVRVTPSAGDGQRTDGLWQTTCCEVFLKPTGEDAYYEVNLAPSADWAAYSFDHYRHGMRAVDLGREPQIEVFASDSGIVLEGLVDLSLITPSRLAAGFTIALSAVIEEADGTKSYWALAHPPGKPDFHHPTCFALTLPAPTEP